MNDTEHFGFDIVRKTKHRNFLKKGVDKTKRRCYSNIAVARETANKNKYFDN